MLPTLWNTTENLYQRRNTHAFTCTRIVIVRAIFYFLIARICFLNSNLPSPLHVLRSPARFRAVFTCRRRAHFRLATYQCTVLRASLYNNSRAAGGCVLIIKLYGLKTALSYDSEAVNTSGRGHTRERVIFFLETHESGRITRRKRFFGFNLDRIEKYVYWNQFVPLELLTF